MTCWHIDFVLLFFQSTSIDYLQRHCILHNDLYGFCICSSIQVASIRSKPFVFDVHKYTTGCVNPYILYSHLVVCPSITRGVTVSDIDTIPDVYN